MELDSEFVSEKIREIYDSKDLKTCPIMVTFRLIGKQWTAAILREMFLGEKQFNRIRVNVKGITPKMLSIRLRELEKYKIINRKIVSEYPIRIEYFLTESGKDLGKIILSAATFSMQHFPKSVFKNETSR